MNITDFLVIIVEKTCGWVIVVVFVLYVGYHCYKIHKDGEALSKTLSILDATLGKLLNVIDMKLGQLISRMDSFTNRL